MTTLYLSFFQIGDARVKSLVEDLKMNQSISALYLSDIGVAGAKGIAEVLKINHSITTLYLSCNRLTDAEVKNIAEALKINQFIAKLILSFNQIGDAGAKDIAEALKINQSITTLHLNSNQIGVAGAKDIAEALKINQSITTLVLDGNQIGVAGAKAIVEALKINKCITALSLSSNQIGDAGAKDISEMLKINHFITSLDLRSNKIGVAGAKDVAEALKINHSITDLYFGDNDIGATGAKDIAEALKLNQSIKTLDLGYNYIGDAVAKAMAETLKINQSITTLYLESNEIGVSGAKDIAEALKINKCITSLYLYSNRIGDAGAKDIAEVLKINHSITTLYLGCNGIKDAGAKDIAEALKINQSIATFDLQSNQIGDAGVEAIAEAFKFNHSITTLYLYDNQIGGSSAEVFKINQEFARKCQRNALAKQIAEQDKFREQEEAKLKALKETKVKEYVAKIPVIKLFLVTDKENQLDNNVQVTVKEILDLIREGHNVLQEHAKKGILLLGDTGAGKSTLAHLLSGRKLQAIMDDQTRDLVIDAMQPLKDIIIGHKLASETKIPNKCLVQNLTIWDCPGFSDTDPVQEIANRFCIKRIFEITEQLKFVLVVPALVLNSGNERGNIFLKTLSNFIKIFNGIECVMESISLVVSHVPPDKNIWHIKESIDKILTDNQGATDEHKALINKLKCYGSIHLFYKPCGEGELSVRDLIAPIDTLSKYSDVNGEMVNIPLSKKAIDSSLHLYSIAGNNCNQLVEVITKAISNATLCSNVNPLNAFSEHCAFVKDWISPSVHYNNLLPKHEKYEYFSELDLLLKLQKVLNCDQIDSISDAIIIFQQAVEIFAEYVEPGNVHLQHKIQEYGYCLQQQYEYVKFFASVCKPELPDHAKIVELITNCHAKVRENLEYQVSSLAIDESKSDPDYYTKAIEYLERYQDSHICKKHKAVAYSCVASIAEKNGAFESALVYYAKAIDANSHSPKIYEKLGQLFFNKGEYKKAIHCYKVVNNEFKIKACFKAWLKQDGENPDVMLKQAEYFESIGLFEQGKKYYHHAFSLSKDDNFKAAALEKIGNIMVNTVAQGQDFITRAQEHDFYNFPLVNEEFTKVLLGIADSTSDNYC